MAPHLSEKNTWVLLLFLTWFWLAFVVPITSFIRDSYTAIIETLKNMAAHPLGTLGKYTLGILFLINWLWPTFIQPVTSRIESYWDENSWILLFFVCWAWMKFVSPVIDTIFDSIDTIFDFIVAIPRSILYHLRRHPFLIFFSIISAGYLQQTGILHLGGISLPGTWTSLEGSLLEGTWTSLEGKWNSLDWAWNSSDGNWIPETKYIVHDRLKNVSRELAKVELNEYQLFAVYDDIITTQKWINQTSKTFPWVYGYQEKAADVNATAGGISDNLRPDQQYGSNLHREIRESGGITLNVTRGIETIVEERLQNFHQMHRKLQVLETTTRGFLPGGKEESVSTKEKFKRVSHHSLDAIDTINYQFDRLNWQVKRNKLFIQKYKEELPHIESMLTLMYNLHEDYLRSKPPPWYVQIFWFLYTEAPQEKDGLPGQAKDYLQGISLNALYAISELELAETNLDRVLSIKSPLVKSFWGGFGGSNSVNAEEIEWRVAEIADLRRENYLRFIEFRDRCNENRFAFERKHGEPALYTCHPKVRA